jgi:hypothetical protein
MGRDRNGEPTGIPIRPTLLRVRSKRLEVDKVHGRRFVRRWMRAPGCGKQVCQTESNLHGARRRIAISVGVTRPAHEYALATHECRLRRDRRSKSQRVLAATVGRKCARLIYRYRLMPP